GDGWLATRRFGRAGYQTPAQVVGVPGRQLCPVAAGQVTPPGDAFADLLEATGGVQEFAFGCGVQDTVARTCLPSGGADRVQQAGTESTPTKRRPDVHVEDAGEVTVEERPGPPGEPPGTRRVRRGVPGAGGSPPGSGERFSVPG